MQEMMGGGSSSGMMPEHGAHSMSGMNTPMPGMSMNTPMHDMQEQERGDPHDGRKHTWDFRPLGPDISSRQPRTMDGMGPRPDPPYPELRSARVTTLAPGHPVRIVRLTLDGDMERYVWELNGKPLFAGDDIRIREGETVRFIMINRTMMHHPMHLHGHFFRVINGQGARSPLKHTVDVPPMQTTVIEFAAQEVGDWFFHCHLLYHLESGMARMVHYEGFEPYPDTQTVRHELYDDPFYFWANADLMSHMTQGYLEFSNTQNIFNLEWEAGWNKVPGTDLELTLLYERYWNRFFRTVAGVNHEAIITSDPARYEEEYTRGVFGIMYTLPLNINALAWVDTEGGWRVRLAKEIPLTPRLMLGGEFRYDSHDEWESRAHLDYLLTRNISLIGQWHSDYGWGAGLGIRF